MNEVHNIVAVFLAEEDPSRIDLWHKNVACLAKTFGAHVHHLKQQDPNTDVLQPVRDTKADVLVLPHGQTFFGPWSRRLTQSSSIPVIYVPCMHELSDPPFTSLLVPMSGEEKENQALDAALLLAESYQLPIDIVHMTARHGHFCDYDPLFSCGADEVHHEYSGCIQHLLQRGSPLSSAHALQHIRSFVHRVGDVSEGLKRSVRETVRPLILVEWSGQIDSGRANVVKALMEDRDVLILLIRSKARRVANLKVGRHFRAGRHLVQEAQH